VRMRDRIFTVGHLRLRVSAAGSFRRAQRWQLELGESGAGRGSQGSHACEPRDLGAGGSHEVHTEIPEQHQSVCEPCEPCEPLYPLRARGRAYTIVEAGKGSPGSQGSQSPVNPRSPACEPPCEPPERGSHRPDRWWEEVI
jgi:hypothetical protein